MYAMTEHECRTFLELCRYLVKVSSRTAFQTAWRHQSYMDARANAPWSLAHYIGLLEKFTLGGHSDHMRRSLSYGQIESKLWLVNQLMDVLPTRKYRIAIVGGWTGLLAKMIFWRMPHLVSQILQIEIDEEAQWIAKHFLDSEREQRLFFQLNQDANTYDFGLNHHLIINCSTEHFADDQWFKNIAPSRLLALQSTDNRDEQTHVNCVSDAKEFSDKFPLDLTLFAGALEIERPARLPGSQSYLRFMRIGRK